MFDAKSETIFETLELYTTQSVWKMSKWRRFASIMEKSLQRFVMETNTVHNYKRLARRSLACIPLRIAPSTFGETQKSPHTAKRRSSTTTHFSSGAIDDVGNAPPLPSSHDFITWSTNIDSVIGESKRRAWDRMLPAMGFHVRGGGHVGHQSLKPCEQVVCHCGQ